MRGRFVIAVLLFGMSAATGCAGCIERVAPGQVASGVARLSVRNSGYIAKLALGDAKCGFANPAIKRAALVQGQPGESGAVTYKVENCTISMPEETVLGKDCFGVSPIAKGTITVSGIQRVVGTITGDPNTPVIPAGADAVHVELDATFDHFLVRKTDSSVSLEQVSGGVHFVFEPRIALSRSLGVCAVQTLDLSFSDIVYSNAKVVVADGNYAFPVDVPESHLNAQSGKWLGQENSFSGDLTVWDSKQTLPSSGDTSGLDPGYAPDAYVDSLKCDPDLVLPISYACPSLKTQLVHGASRLTVKTVGALASLIASDTRCGFSSAQVLANATISGSPGAAGSATFSLRAPCVLSFPTKTSLGKDCTGQEQFAQGSVSITGTEKLTGVLTGDTTQPAAPTTRDPAQLVLHAEFNDFTLSNSTGENTFVVAQGALDATVVPRVAIDTRTDICSNTTSIAEFPSLVWQGAKATVTTSGFQFQVDLSQAQLVAQSGTNGDRSNYLAGSVISDGVPVTIPPLGSDPVLDPSYDQAAFLASFSCAPGFKMADSDAACSLDSPLATNLARLTVQAAGTLAAMVQNDTVCGFSALLVAASPTDSSGSTGQMGFLKWDISNCPIGQTGPLLRGTDCSGTQSYVSGSAQVSGERLVTGERTTKYVVFSSIIPRSRDAMTITLNSVPLTEFSTWSVLPSEVDPFAKLVLHSGTMSAIVKPVLGERVGSPGQYDVGTPVATFTNVELLNATATLSVAGKSFLLSIPALKVSGQNGSFNGVTNTLSGAVTLSDGHVFTIAPTALDPNFAQASFDSSYACTADLVAPISLH